MSVKKTWVKRVVAKIVSDYLKQMTEVDEEAIDAEDRTLVCVCHRMRLHPDDVKALKAEILKESKSLAKYADLPERWGDVREAVVE